MARGKPLTVVAYMCMPDGSTKPFEELTAKELDDWDRRRVHRTSRAMSDYYRQHPDELEKLEAATPEEEEAFYERFPEYKKSSCQRATATT